MADEGVGGLAYSGKVMRPTPFTPSVDALRQLVERKPARVRLRVTELVPGGPWRASVRPDLGRRRGLSRHPAKPGGSRFGRVSGVCKSAPEHYPRSRGRRLDVRRLQRHVGALRDAGRERRARRRERERRAARLGGVQAVAGDGKARRRARTRRRRRGEKKRVVRKNPREPPTRRRRFEFGARRARERRERAGNERRGRETIDAGRTATLRRRF